MKAGREKECELRSPGIKEVFRKCTQPCAFEGNEHRGVVRNKAWDLARGQFIANF